MTIEVLTEPGTTEPPTYHNRRGGLIFFGLLQMAIGGFFLLMLLMLLLSLAATRHSSSVPAMPASTLVMATLMYGGASILFITLGVGSMLGRRWARDLSLIVGWMWLCFGLVATVMLVILVPRFLNGLPQQTPGSSTVIAGCMAVMAALFCILLPLSLVLFYRSPHVYATSRALDPVTRWTDRAPLSVIGLSSYLMLTSVTVAICSSYAAFALPDRIVTGAPAVAIYLAMACVIGWVAVGIYQLKRAAWWTGIGYGVVMGTYCAIVFPRVNYAELVKAMHIPQSPATPDLTGMYRSPMFLSWIALSWVFYFGYFLAVRRHVLAEPPSNPLNGS